MAIVRCDKHGPPKELKISYTHRHSLKPGPRLICAASTCAKPAVLWLSDNEEAEYRGGIRLFTAGSRGGVEVE